MVCRRVRNGNILQVMWRRYWTLRSQACILAVRKTFKYTGKYRRTWVESRHRY